MQLYALDSERQLTSARGAVRQTNYYCLECQQLVRLRGGVRRRRHFYHLEPTPDCRQHQKGLVHLQLQWHFLQQLPVGDCQLEKPFNAIHRIADVAWLSQKIIFEIQCSPISAEEVIARNRDYQKLGWSVIWILHDRRYNQTRLSAAEMALRSSPHFFSNMDSDGIGIIYDQFDICKNGRRHERLPPLPIDLREPPSTVQEQLYPLSLLSHRAKYWKYFFKDDLMNLFLQTPDIPYLQQAMARENSFFSASQSFTGSRLYARLWQKGIVMPYQILFRFLLERMCR